MHRQHFRGQMWHVLQDPSSNQFFRLNEAAYRFVASLDGRRTVSEVWGICNEQVGDSAPTQGEAIQLLGQLYASNLLQGELPPDAEGLFNRYRKRVSREVRGYLTNLLFIRIPLFDPDRFLDRWLKVLGWVFSPAGLVVWMLLVGMGLYFGVGRWDELFSRTREFFANALLSQNLLVLYGSFVIAKVFHEFGHALACKKFGVQTGAGGEVHVMGIMFLVFTPMPYVDASSSWAFRSKWHRIVVGAAGMLVELALAGVALAVWAHTAEGSTINALAYNVVFIASVSTIIFNANPLLRYDGYYILSDLLEIPNLAQRSKEYLHYLVKRYAWGVKRLRNPAHTRGEKAWFALYGPASIAYRTVVVVAILLFVYHQLWLLGMLLAVAAAFAWICVPMGKFVHYLAVNQELQRVRPRAVVSTLATLAAVAAGVGLVPAGDAITFDGVVEPRRLAIVYPAAGGFVESHLASSSAVAAGGGPLVLAANDELQSQLDALEAQAQSLDIQRRKAQGEGYTGAAQSLSAALAAVERDIVRRRAELASLSLASPIAGEFISPNIDRSDGMYLPRGKAIGMVASPDDVFIRAAATHDVAARLVDQVQRSGSLQADVRVLGRPDLKLTGQVRSVGDILPQGQDQLPSAALGYQAGGAVPVSPEDREGTKAARRFFEVRVYLPPAEQRKVRLLSGQRVAVRFETDRKPLATQWWRWALQLIEPA